MKKINDGLHLIIQCHWVHAEKGLCFSYGAEAAEIAGHEDTATAALIYANEIFCYSLITLTESWHIWT